MNKSDHYFRELDQQWERDVEKERVAKSRAARIRELMVDEGMTRAEAKAWAEMEGV